MARKRSLTTDFNQLINVAQQGEAYWSEGFKLALEEALYKFAQDDKKAQREGRHFYCSYECYGKDVMG